MIIGNRILDENKPHVWGILNVTPDSFSDGGKYNGMDAAMLHAEEMIKSGADIIDVGGMSTRPGHEDISIEEEINRLCPVVEKLKDSFDILISADTYRARTAEAAGKAGAHLINDIWGLKWDADMARVIAEQNLSCCIMHNGDGIYTYDFVAQWLDQIKESLDIAKRAGIGDDRIILDPGIGFAKTMEQNIVAINQLDRLAALGYPVLLGTSRKRIIGAVLDLPVDEREEGTMATTLFGLSKNIMHFRVHDVEKNVRAIRMWMAMKEGKLEV